MINASGASYLPDLIHLQMVEDASFPPDARHSSVSLLTPGEAKTLIETYPNKTVLPKSSKNTNVI